MNKIGDFWHSLSHTYSSSKKTIKLCSYDDAKKEYLVTIEREAFDFDEISEEVAKFHYQCIKPRSVDCVFLKDQIIYLVEFKNSSKNKWDDLKMKVHDTMLLLDSVYDFNISDHQSMKVIIVTKNCEDPRARMSHHMNKIAGSSCPSRLKFLKDAYNVDISTVMSDEFESLFA